MYTHTCAPHDLYICTHIHTCAPHDLDSTECCRTLSYEQRSHYLCHISCVHLQAPFRVMRVQCQHSHRGGVGRLRGASPDRPGPTVCCLCAMLSIHTPVSTLPTLCNTNSCTGSPGKGPSPERTVHMELSTLQLWSGYPTLLAFLG